jgi:hypothetical protein
MTTGAERNIGFGSVAAGLGAMTFAMVSGLTTADGGPDWVGIITVAAGLILVVTGLFNVFRHGAA